MATASTTVSPRKSDHPRENRVWGFFSDRPRFAYQIDSQVLETHRVPRPTATPLASGIPVWLSRDPIGESGGVNLYGFVGNDGANGWDLLGLECEPAGYSVAWEDGATFFSQMIGGTGKPDGLHGAGHTGRDFVDFLEKLTQDCCCIKDLRIAGHGGPNGFGGTFAGETGFYGTFPGERPVPGEDGRGPNHPLVQARDISDLEAAIKDGKIQFCPDCTIKIHACCPSAAFLEKLAKATGCRATGPDDSVVANIDDRDGDGNDSANSHWSTSGNWLQSNAGAPAQVLDLPVNSLGLSTFNPSNR